MAFKSVVQDMRNYLGGLTLAPDSVNTDPIDPAHIVIGMKQQFASRHNGIQVVLNVAAAIANPKWLRDEYTLSIQVYGQDSTYIQQCEQMIDKAVKSLLGVPTRYINDSAYVQFNSSQLPAFVGYLDNSIPIYSATVSFVVEGLTDETYRKALC